jgi:hypothetical protein
LPGEAGRQSLLAPDDVLVYQAEGGHLAQGLGGGQGRQVFLHTDHPADLVGSLDVLRDLHEFVRRSRDVMPTKVKAPRLPVWMRQVARDVWEFDKNRRDVYIGLMELLCPKESFDLVRKRAKRLWKETINSSKTSN